MITNINFEEFYNKQKDYKQFRDNPLKQEEYKVWVDWKARNLVNIIPDNLKFSSVLEIGCAFGLLLDNISKRLKIPYSFGIDISPKNIQLAQKLFPNYEFYVGTLENFAPNIFLKNNSEKFDLVILSDIIEHVLDDARFLQKVSQITNYALVKLPLEKCFYNKNRKYGLSDLSGHLRSYNEIEGLNLIERSGFNIINKKVEISLKDSKGYLIWKNEQNLRVSQKTFFKKVFWTYFYNCQDVILNNFETLYKRIWGSNLFCFIKSKS